MKLIFSSVDGQIVDQFAVMHPDSTGLRHVAQLPPSDGRKERIGSGIQQDFVYRISAGDATTAEFRLRASPAPTMTVDAVEYEFPPYTRRSREVVERQGDLKAIEGTRVTVRARANQSIKTATIEMTSSPTAGAAPGINERLAMEFRDTNAWRTWTLELAADRQSPKFTTYQATFVNQKGLASRDPVTHRIEVVPDLPPEIEILTPNKETTQVTVSGEQRIEIRAIDPDFGLSSVRLKAVCAGREFLDQPLFEDSVGQSGQAVVEYRFRPREHQLSAGSHVTYWVVAADNRHTEISPQPNTAKTANRTLMIVEDPQAPSTKPGDPAADKPESPAGDSQPMPPADPKAADKPQSTDPNGKREPDQKQPDQKQQPQKQQDQKQQARNSKAQIKVRRTNRQVAESRVRANRRANRLPINKKEAQSGKGQPQSGKGQSGKQQPGGSSGSNQPSTSQPGPGENGPDPSGNTPQQNSPAIRYSNQ